MEESFVEDNNISRKKQIFLSLKWHFSHEQIDHITRISVTKWFFPTSFFLLEIFNDFNFRDSELKYLSEIQNCTLKLETYWTENAVSMDSSHHISKYCTLLVYIEWSLKIHSNIAINFHTFQWISSF